MKLTWRIISGDIGIWMRRRLSSRFGILTGFLLFFVKSYNSDLIERYLLKTHPNYHNSAVLIIKFLMVNAWRLKNGSIIQCQILVPVNLTCWSALTSQGHAKAISNFDSSSFHSGKYRPRSHNSGWLHSAQCQSRLLPEYHNYNWD